MGRQGVITHPAALLAHPRRHHPRHGAQAAARRGPRRWRRSPSPATRSTSPSEVFFTGTAAEITPVREVDNRQVGDGKPGPVTSSCRSVLPRRARPGAALRGVAHLRLSSPRARETRRACQLRSRGSRRARGHRRSATAPAQAEGADRPARPRGLARDDLRAPEHGSARLRR